MNTRLPPAAVEAYDFLSLAHDLHRAGRDKAAEALYQQAILRIESNVGSGHPCLVPFLHAYEAFLRGNDREAEAACLKKRSEEIQNSQPKL